jgi:aldose 1-epimerase
MEILLSSGDYRAVVSPHGASLRRFWKVTPQGDRDIAWGYAHRDEKKGGQGDVLIPFPGRIPGGEYRFQGKDYTLERNDKEGPNAIHGFVRTRDWAARSSETAAGFRLKLLASEMSAKGYPFSLDIGVSYQLSSTGLRCEFSIQNIGENDAPVAAGFHPYFVLDSRSDDSRSDDSRSDDSRSDDSRSDDSRSDDSGRVDAGVLRLPARKLVEFGPGFIPTGQVLPVSGTPLDFVSPRPIGSTVINNCLTDLERDSNGIAHATLLDPATRFMTRIWMSSRLEYLVVYTGEALGPDARRAIAIEPMTCGTDAFNRPEWGLQVLKPWEFLTGSWGVSADFE